MKIQIRSHEGALELVQQQPFHHDIAFITSPQTPFPVPGSEGILKKARNSIMLQFDDVDGPMEDFVPPRREQIKELLEWACDKTNLVISCRAGISRSSAAAVVVMASRVSILDALTILEPETHWPNLLIVQYGEEILRKPGLTDAVREWKRWRQASQTSPGTRL
jgi:predicted protein tyrosine phosphatase